MANPRRPKPKTANQLEADCIVWNHKYPVGTQVEFHPVIGKPEFMLYRTRSEAQVLSGHTAVVFLDGKSGCVALEACVPIVADPEPAQVACNDLQCQLIGFHTPECERRRVAANG